MPDRLLDDLQLVASELITNAIEHGAKGIVTMDVNAHDGRVMLTVTSAGDGTRPGPPETWVLPEPHRADGRGLALTSLLAQEVEIHRSDGASGPPGWVAIVAHLG